MGPKLAMVPTVKPAAPTWSLSVAARPGTVVPLSTATVTLAGSIAAPCLRGLSCCSSSSPESEAGSDEPPAGSWAAGVSPPSSELSWVTPNTAAPPRMSTPAIVSTR